MVSESGSHHAGCAALDIAGANKASSPGAAPRWRSCACGQHRYLVMHGVWQPRRKAGTFWANSSTQSPVWQPIWCVHQASEIHSPAHGIAGGRSCQQRRCCQSPPQSLLIAAQSYSPSLACSHEGIEPECCLRRMTVLLSAGDSPAVSPRQSKLRLPARC